MLGTQRLGRRVNNFTKQLTEWQKSVVELSRALVQLWENGEKYGRDHIVRKNGLKAEWAIFKHMRYEEIPDEED